MQILDRQIWDWYHLCLYKVMMMMVTMVMVVTSMLIMTDHRLKWSWRWRWWHWWETQVEMIVFSFFPSNYHKPSKYNLLCWQQISSNILFFHRFLLRLPCFVLPLLDQVMMIMWGMMINLLCTVCVRLFVCWSVLCLSECICVCFYFVWRQCKIAHVTE